MALDSTCHLEKELNVYDICLFFLIYQFPFSHGSGGDPSEGGTSEVELNYSAHRAFKDLWFDDYASPRIQSNI